MRDVELLRRARTDERCFERFVDEWLAFALHVTRDLWFADADRADLVQECRIGLWMVVRDYDPALSSVHSFVRLVVRRRLIAQAKQSRNLKRRLLNEAIRVLHDEEGEEIDAPDLVAAPNTDPAEILDRRARARRLLNAVGALSGVERAAVEGVLGGLSYQQVADSRGGNWKQVDNGLQRARRKLALVA